MSFVDGKSLVLDAVDLVKLVGETVPLKKAGRRYVGLCPFHSEKSPSFGVDPAKQFFYCFGCKKGGNAIDFIIERDRVDFRTALEELADWAGVELPKFKGEGGDRGDRLQRLRDACSAAAGVYRDLLKSNEGKAARDYLLGRGFTQETFDRFGLGFAPDAWDTLARHGLHKKFGEETLLEAGLLKQGDRGRYDTFRGRVIFPIRDEQGRPVAFGGRVLPGSDSPAKYLNSPETPLFSKSRILFGLDVAKRDILSTKTAIVFEGYADAAMAHQHGIGNAVAVLGTALTAEHAAALRRLAEKVVLVFDADTAGGLATRRSVELFLREPIEVAVAELPKGMDPDEFLQTEGAEALTARLEKATDALSFQWKLLISQVADGNVTARQKAVRTYLGLLAEARREAGTIDDVRWGAVLTRVSRLTGLSTDDLNRQFPGSRPAARPARGAPLHRGRPTGPVVGAMERAEAQLLGALFNRPALWVQVQAHVSPATFVTRQHRFLGELFWEHLRNEGEPSFAEWLDVVASAVLSAGGSEASAERARLTCIELAANAEVLGDAAEVAAASVIGFRRLRGEEGVNELLTTLRRTARQGEVPESGEDSAAPAEEAKLLRDLEERLRASGRAKPKPATGNSDN